MIYEISSVSNRDSLLLHHYRILRQEQAETPAPFHVGTGSELYLSPTNRASGSWYRQSVAVPVSEEGSIPILIFDSDSSGIDCLADLIQVDAFPETGLLYIDSSRPMTSVIKFKFFWYSINTQVNQLLTWRSDAETRLEELENWRKSYMEEVESWMKETEDRISKIESKLLEDSE